jgi:hypothetical protein
MRVLPVFPEPPSLRCEVGPLEAWYTRPAGAVLQLTEVGPFTKEMADWIVGPAYEAFTLHFPGHTELRLLLDIRPLTSREPAARRVILEAGAKYLRAFSHVAILAPTKPPPLYMTTLTGAVALMSAFGPDIALHPDLPTALKHLGLQPGG